MRPLERSPSSSPSRKRARLSSPTYDDHYQSLSQQDLAAFDEIEARLSQPAPRPVKLFSKAPSPAVGVDDDNPFITNPPVHPPFQTASGFSSVHFASASLAQRGAERSPSPEAPPEVDYDAWFQSAPQGAVATFQTAGSAALSNTPMAPDAVLGFQTASKKGFLAPSHTALMKAKKLMNDIWVNGPSSTGEENVDSAHSTVPDRPAVDSRGADGENHATRVSSSHTFRSANPAASSDVRPPRPESPTPSQSPLAMLKGKGKLFQLPSRVAPQIHNEVQQDSVATPIRPASAFRGASTLPHPPSQFNAPTTTPGPRLLSSTPNPSRFVTPVKSLGITPRSSHLTGKRTTPAPFITPFKTGMKPGEPGHAGLVSSLNYKQTSAPAPQNFTKRSTSPQKPDRQGFFDMTPSQPRVSLARSLLYPQQHSDGTLEELGINFAELRQMTPDIAIYYSFHTPSSTPSATSDTILGSSAALDHLLKLGCNLATKAWVDNHWGLILWKLAGLVLLDPDSEQDPTKRRWCWSEVIRQLLYRYERELNSGIRPALRLITTQDAPAGYPLTLCVSSVSWTQPDLTEDGDPTPAYAEVEVTDGWYRLRAQVDAPLTRAIKRGIIQVGRKISVAGARLSSERKDPSEVLDAYNSTKLVLAGNSSHLAPWHAKLGFNPGTCVSTLHSLTPDGGCVAAMDVTVVQAHPLAFLELIEDDDGRRHNEGPRNEAEEARENNAWQRRREQHIMKLQDALEKKWMHIEGCIDRLQRRASSSFHPHPDDPVPDRIESMYDDLEDSSSANILLANIPPRDASWLAVHARKTLAKEREQSFEGIEAELKTLCPPRNVRSFRVLVVEDARNQRRPSNRRAQLTVWDVLGLELAEGEQAGSFEKGQRYLITNLVPTQQSAWMGTEPGSEVYLATRRDSKWMRVKTTSI